MENQINCIIHEFHYATIQTNSSIRSLDILLLLYQVVSLVDESCQSDLELESLVGVLQASTQQMEILANHLNTPTPIQHVSTFRISFFFICKSTSISQTVKKYIYIQNWRSISLYFLIASSVLQRMVFNSIINLFLISSTIQISSYFFFQSISPSSECLMRIVYIMDVHRNTIFFAIFTIAASFRQYRKKELL